MIKLIDILNEGDAYCYSAYKQRGINGQIIKKVPNCTLSSFINEGIDDLVGDTYSFVIGSSTEKLITPNTLEYIIEKISKTLYHYLFDWDFYYSYLDSSEKNIYRNLFELGVLRPRLYKNNIDRTLKKYFVVDFNKKKVSWKLSSRDSEKIRDDFFRKNKKIPSNIKQKYYDYRLNYAGVILRESATTSVSQCNRQKG